MSDVLPMFPLGTVLLPGMVLPLHVFEPRYQALLLDCQEGEPEFGVVLIERGREVGGGDVRRDVGTVARILEIQALPGGRSAVVSVGTRRFRVARWLEDDPYPRAEVDPWPDADDLQAGSTAIDDTVAHLRRVLALASEAGERAPAATAELADEPVLASYHAAALAPIGEDDRYRLLAAAGPAARCAALDDCLAGVEELLRFRLERGSDRALARALVGGVLGRFAMPGEDKGRTGNDVTEVFDVVKAYATQETLGPLKDIGRWLGFGVAGIVFLSLGLLMLLIGLLRVLQTETTVFHGNWSWVPYVITLAVAVIVIAIALSRMKKLEFDGEEQGR